MSTETLYAYATAPGISSFSSKPLRFPVAVGEIENPDGVVFDTSVYKVRELNKKNAVKYKGVIWPKGSMEMLDNPTRPAQKALRKKHKLERQNRRKGRK